MHCFIELHASFLKKKKLTYHWSVTERKLQGTELPHHLYIQNYSTASATCLCVRKFLFSIRAELSLAADEQAMTYIFWSAVDAVDRGHIRPEDRLYQLKALQDSSRKNEVRAESKVTEINRKLHCSGFLTLQVPNFFPSIIFKIVTVSLALMY